MGIGEVYGGEVDVWVVGTEWGCKGYDYCGKTMRLNCLDEIFESHIQILIDRIDASKRLVLSG